MKKVSLYIPCYNAEQYIGECLDGVIKQTYPINEILLIDDGSTDNTVSIVSKYPVRVVHHKKNIGLAAARNTAFNIAKNEFVAALDADCVPHSDWLHHIMECFNDDTIIGVGGKLIEKYTVSLADEWRSVHLTQQWGNDIIENPPYLTGCNTVFRKDVIKNSGLYNTFYRINYEDIDLSHRLMSKGLTFIYIPHAIVEHIRRDTIFSALHTFWKWQFYNYIKPQRSHDTLRTVAGYTAKLACFTEPMRDVWEKDYRAKSYKRLLIDFLLFFFYPFLDLKSYIQLIAGSMHNE